MEFKNISFEKNDGVARITLNRPEALNALSLELIFELGMAADNVEKDETVRVVIIGAKGRAFCAGADLKSIRGHPRLTPRTRKVY